MTTNEGLPNGVLSAECLAVHKHGPGDYSAKCWAIPPRSDKGDQR